MVFEMQVVSNTPLIGEEKFEDAAKKFFEQIGYLSKGSDPSIPYRLFADFFLKHPTKGPPTSLELRKLILDPRGNNPKESQTHKI